MTKEELLQKLTLVAMDHADITTLDKPIIGTHSLAPCLGILLYDEEKKKIYEAHDAAMWEKYGRGIHAHEDAETGKELSSKLFMSDKKRPAWDLDYMMEIGFSKVFALKDISDISRTSMERELNKLTPQFLVGGEK